LLNRLEEKGYIKLIDTSNSKAYLVTEKGFEAYLKWIKEFLSFVRTINDGDADENLD
jgi:DNA-binding PadR family transcriptional regulator